jgi:hypothetical protein
MNITNLHNNVEIYYNRIKNYKKLIKYLNTIASYQCLNVAKKNNGLFEYKISNGKIVLKKQIGSKSKYGVVFLTKNDFSEIMFATKLTPQNLYNYNELQISKKLSNIVIADKSPHFLIIYKYIYCNDMNYDNVPEIIRRRTYYISINELADGNLKDFLEFNKDPYNTLNAYQQILLSILSFHYFTNNYYHNDCHYKNFLFHKIKPGGYFHYKIYKKDVYVENLGFVWVIWDFGLVKMNTGIYKYNQLNDYFRFNDMFKPTSNSYNISLINEFISNLKELEYVFIDLIGNSDKLLFEKYLFNMPNLFTFNINKIANKIVNKKPYIIS